LEIKKKNSEKAKMNRQKEKSETEMEKIREGNRIRARNYRERQKALGIEKKRRTARFVGDAMLIIFMITLAIFSALFRRSCFTLCVVFSSAEGLLKI
jgi:hypothetical protein